MHTRETTNHNDDPIKAAVGMLMNAHSDVESKIRTIFGKT